jgi:hypothetical protein
MGANDHASRGRGASRGGDKSASRGNMRETNWGSKRREASKEKV